MSIASQITLLAQTKEAQRIKLGLDLSIPWAEYIDYFGTDANLPKLVANFTTGEYKAGGEAKTFAEVFTFNRAGKAWLVKDTGLVEYTTDTPRFDDGLLIEQAATNHRTLRASGSTTNYSFTRDGDLMRATCLVTNTDTQLSNDFLINDYGAGTSAVGNHLYTSVQLKSTNTQALLGSNGYGGDYKSRGISGLLVFRVVVESIGDLRSRLGLGTYTTQYEAKAGDFIEYSNPQYIITDTYFNFQSTIKTGDTPVTRPADFLQTKVSGTTVTGDWDSTLSLSIVNGQIVHSGYGRIRSLEIN